MNSEPRSKKKGRRSELEKRLGPIPENVLGVPCQVTDALIPKEGTWSAARKEWVSDRKSFGAEKGLKASRAAGTTTTKTKARELRKYIERHYNELLVLGNYSDIAAKILHREVRKSYEGWSDSLWPNDGTAVRRSVPSLRTLRKIVSEIISGKG